MTSGIFLEGITLLEGDRNRCSSVGSWSLTCQYDRMETQKGERLLEHEEYLYTLNNKGEAQ